ncbi:MULTISPECIES: ABC transporter ATP-binding protein [unclassified Cupriavidus]|uniref:ABC transporter ATP-binding protein n=1 Tax=unclassified Cupriavidus TaxID=2640874 RepID=UPI0010F6A24F|nr:MULTISPECIES: ABC transporter ATP-binding protein [unclassified Cupriavidus]MWL86792.1 ATP-binding cassette domain-containing protein [Cupriavidus sp. SW-Y-13]
MDAVTLSNVSRQYALGVERVAALSDVSLRIGAQRFTVLAGPSGSGKSTLLNLIGCIDRPDAGRVRIGGKPVGDWSDSALTDFRARHIGFIFQNFNLLPVLTASENIEYPLLVRGVPAAERRWRVRDMLEAVGLGTKGRHRPNQLSGGQCQRVAIARALIHAPELVLADEPTASLDTHTALDILKLMRTLQRTHRTTFVFSSHDPMVISHADDLIRLRDGRLDAAEPVAAAGVAP